MIGSSENRISYDGNGIATEFAYTFKILEKSDLFVLHVATDGTETVLTKDYYVDMKKSVVLYPGYAPGAEIPEQNRPSILPVGERLVIYREVPITQESALDKHWPFNVVENGLDKLTIICQQMWDRLTRSFYVSEATSTNFDTKIPIEAGKTFRVKDDGTGFEVTEDPGKVIDGAKALLKQTTEQAEFAKEQADESSQSAVNAQNAAKEAEKIATDLGLVDEAVQTAVSSAEQASNSATTASNKADVATAKADIATTKASEASVAADTATQKAEAANTSATNAAQSYTNADAIATQLTEYLATKETITAPVVDKTLLIEGAAADSKVVGELKSDLVAITEHDIGKNIFFSEWTEKGQTIDMDTGADKTDTVSHRTGYVEVEANTTYTMSTDFGKAPSVYVFFYDENKSFISIYETPYGFYPKTFTTPSGTKYIRVREGYEAMPTNFQVEKGSVATSYEAPYNRLVVPASVVKDIPRELPTDGEVGQFLKKTIDGPSWANVSGSYNMTYKGKRFLFLGDSITAMNGDTSWVDKFKVLAEVGESYKQAVGGAKWCDDESGIEYTGKPYQEQNFIGNQVVWCQKINFDSNAFDYIFISAGTNDTNFTFPTDEQIESEMYSNDSTVKSLASVDRTTWMGAIRWSIETLRGMYPNAKIILVTPLQRRVDMDGTTLKDMYSIIRQKREIIIKMAKRMGVYVIDTSECDITNFDSTDFADNLHPSAKGAEKLAKFIFKKSIGIFCEYN